MSSPTVVTKRLTAYLIVGLDACLEFSATVSYDSHDPYAVRLAFRVPGGGDGPADPFDVSSVTADPAAPVADDRAPTWTFGRELLADGLREPSGDGDVHIWPCGPDLVMFELRSADESALIAVPARGLRAFLFLSYAEVPPGYEGRYLHLEDVLHDLTGRA